MEPHRIPWGEGRKRLAGGRGRCLENTVTPKNKIHLCINRLKACREVENMCHLSRKILLFSSYFIAQEKVERPEAPSNNNIRFHIKKNPNIQSSGQIMSKAEPKQQQQQRQQKTTKIKIRGHSSDPIPAGKSNGNSISRFSQLAPERINLCKRTFLSMR